jgi:hypothetical protein
MAVFFCIAVLTVQVGGKIPVRERKNAKYSVMCTHLNNLS